MHNNYILSQIGGVSNSDQQIVFVNSTLSSNIFFVAVGCACALVGVFITMVTAYYFKTKKIRRGMLQ